MDDLLELHAEIESLLKSAKGFLEEAAAKLQNLNEMRDALSNKALSELEHSMLAILALSFHAGNIEELATEITAGYRRLVLVENLYRLLQTGDEDYETKKDIVEMANKFIRPLDLVFENPATKEPSIIYAITSYDKKGRYTFESRITKKRSGSYKSILEMMPLKLVKDIPRKEGFIEGKKQKKV